MLQDEVLIFKFLSGDELAESVIVACEVTTLTHESWNNSVKLKCQVLPLQCSEYEIFLLELCLQTSQRRWSPEVQHQLQYQRALEFVKADSKWL